MFHGLVMGPVSPSIFINDEVGGENTNSMFIKGKRVLNWEVLQTPQRTKKQRTMGMVEAIWTKERRTGFHWVTRDPAHLEERPPDSQQGSHRSHPLKKI